MKNVLFVHSSSELYGSDRSLLNIVKYIDKQKFTVYVILPCEGPLVEEMKKIHGVNVEIFEVAVLRRKNFSLRGGMEYVKEFVSSCKYLKKYIVGHDINVVDTNTAVVFPGAFAAKRKKVKSVWHIREIIKSSFENKIISFVMRHYADVIVANSQATGNALNVNPDMVRVVYNAVEEKKETSAISHTGMHIGMAGRINRWKGQKLFVDAAVTVHEKYPDAVFEIAGDAYSGESYLRDDLKNYISDKGAKDYVMLLGQVNDMDNFYRKLDVFVLPSIQPEPFGLVVIEAMEYRVPVIATNHGGPTEIIQDGVDGFLVDYHTAGEMAERIMLLLGDKNMRQTMGKAGQEKKRSLFSVYNMVKNMERILGENI